MQWGALLPPTRFLYIACGYTVHVLTGQTPMASLQIVSCGASILALLLAGLFAWRMAGREMALGTFALMAVAPAQIFMAKYPLIDGVFACLALLALWLLWENLRVPENPARLAGYTAATALLVMTKENSAFVMLGLGGVLAVNQWLKFGKTTPALLACTVVGPLIGVAVLITLSGGVEPFVETYRLLVTKAYHLDFAIKTGDGPWHRYLFDYALVSPVILLLAIGAAFQLKKTGAPHHYLISFICATYLVMANVKYGMNLRYATMWDMPLRFLAFSQLGMLCGQGGSRRILCLAALVIGVCGVELVQYDRIFVQSHLAEMVSEDLLRALNIVK